MGFSFSWLDLSVAFGYFWHLYVNLGPATRRILTLSVDTATCDPFNRSRYQVSVWLRGRQLYYAEFGVR